MLDAPMFPDPRLTPGLPVLPAAAELREASVSADSATQRLIRDSGGIKGGMIWVRSLWGEPRFAGDCKVGWKPPQAGRGLLFVEDGRRYTCQLEPHLLPLLS